MILLWVFSIFLSLISLGLCVGPIVQTPYGEIEGFEHKMQSGDKADVFLGIRYANAPDHVYRFEKPEPVDKWHFRHQATHFRASCIPFHHDALLRDNYSEDCLFLNIVTPEKKKQNPDKLLPVLVFIHGGGFEIGDSEMYGYVNASESFVSQGIIFVSIQYRLGPFGFFSTGDSVMPGNTGLWDQTLALQFLHETLASFGGDANKITVSGHSAGSSSTSALLFSPHSDHLFNQAIEMSGSVFAEYSMSESVVKESLALAAAVGCNFTDSKKIHDCMKERTAEEIIHGVNTIEPTRRHSNFIKFQPRFDKDFFPYEVDQMVRKAPKKKTLQGVTNRESALFAYLDGIDYLSGGVLIPKDKRESFTRGDLIEFIIDAVAPEVEFGRKMGPFLQLLTDFYVDVETGKQNSNHYADAYVDLMSDLQFNIPTFHEISLKRIHGWETYYYVIDYESATRPTKFPVAGAYHGDELRFLYQFIGQEKIPLDDNDKLFQKHFRQSFVNFIKTGNPSTSDFEWNPVSKENADAYLRFNSHPSMSKGFRSKAVDFWLNVVPKAIGADILRNGRLPAAKAHNTHTEL